MAHLRTLLAAFVVALFLAVSLAATGLMGCNPVSPSGCSGICLEYCECLNGSGSRTCQTGMCATGGNSADCRSNLFFYRLSFVCRS